MDARDFDRLIKHLSVAFPDVWEWLNAISPDPNATLDIWHKALASCHLDECLHVIDDWITGRRPVFKAYERSQIAILIRQCVQFDRDKEAQRNRTHSSSDEYRKTRRADYKPLAQSLPALGVIYREGAKLKADFLEGKLTSEQFQREKEKLLEGVL